MKFVQNLYEFHVNFVQFGNKESKHTSKHTLQSHGHVIDHSPAFIRPGDRHAGAVLSRCHSVVRLTGGATPDMAKWISDSASTLSALRIPIRCTLPTKTSMLCSAISMTARSELMAERESKVGWKGHVGGPVGTPRGRQRRGSGEHPSHNPTFQTTPFPTHNTWSTLGKSQVDNLPATARVSWAGGGGGAVHVRGVGLVVAVPGVGGPQVKKKAPCSPSFESGRARNPWWRLVATISSMSPLCS